MNSQPNQDDSHEDDEPGPTPEQADWILKDPQQLAGLIRSRPDLLQNLASGYHAVREGFGEFLTANDRGASRVKDTADRLIDAINDELGRGGLGAEERAALVEAQMHALQEVRGNEKDVREANERSYAKLAAIGISVAVSAVALGYLTKEGKLPLSPPTTSG